ncbi:hypothetical protein ANN_26182 [Periplaneta americana]|uniref:EGF-like domain-containing protein n=1 Tax=Periplaneta americana TaxID=6978 RepID=A0ABQ8S581_PERAM|nr:hypothetical protein ANN_26182 [Periplaneta americana]
MRGAGPDGSSGRGTACPYRLVRRVISPSRIQIHVRVQARITILLINPRLVHRCEVMVNMSDRGTSQKSVSCPPNQFRCEDSVQCLPVTLLCDGALDCPDESDEGEFCHNVTLCESMQCAHGCRPSLSGPLCFCPEGQQPNKSLCVDSDECLIDGSCDQLCTNKNGSFDCRCVPGYEKNGTSCTAINGTGDLCLSCITLWVPNMVANRETQDQTTNVSKENDAQNYGRIIEGENPNCDTVPTSRYIGHHTCSHYIQMEMGWTRGQVTRRQMDISSYHVGPPDRKETSRQTSAQMGRLLQRTGGSTMVQRGKRQKKVETTRETFVYRQEVTSTGLDNVGPIRCQKENLRPVTAIPSDEPASIVFSSTADIRRIHLNGSSYPGNSSLTPLQTLALEFNHRNRSLCFILHNSSNARLSCANIDNLSDSWDLPTPTMFPLDSMTHIALDWISGNWYFLDDTREMIFLCNSTMQACVILVGVNLSKPRGIALDPTKGFMFFTKWGASSPMLERTLLDGSNRTTLVQQKIVYPYGVTVDYPTQQVYWVDTYLDFVERIDYDGSNRRTIKKGFPVSSFDKWHSQCRSDGYIICID